MLPFLRSSFRVVGDCAINIRLTWICKLLQLVDVKRVVRLDVRWLLCSAGKVFDYVKDLANCAADINIFLQQVCAGPR